VSNKCQRYEERGAWVCDRCGSMWHESWAGADWLPLSCFERHANIIPNNFAHTAHDNNEINSLLAPAKIAHKE